MFLSRILLISAISLLSTAPHALAVVYKWSDSSGNVIYSQMPPPEGTTYEIVENRSPGKADAGNPSGTQAIQKRLDESRQARAERKSQQKRIAQSNKIKKENCQRANDNLRTLTSHGQVSIKENGLYRKLTEEERQQRIQTTQASIEEFCN